MTIHYPPGVLIFMGIHTGILVRGVYIIRHFCYAHTLIFSYVILRKLNRITCVCTILKFLRLQPCCAYHTTKL